MQDPLSLIRQATMRGEAIAYSDGHYLLPGGLRLPENTKTAFKRTLRATDDYYTVRDIAFFLEYSKASIAEYRRKVVEMKIVAIVEQDRVQLLDYLTGKIDGCAQIDVAMQAAYKPPASASAPAASSASVAKPTKRPAEEKPEDETAGAAAAEREKGAEGEREAKRAKH
eukprot:gene9731-11942_t